LDTTGEITVTAVHTIPGDFNGDAADYVVWRKNSGGQANNDAWRTNFGRTLAGSGSATSSAAPSSALVWEPNGS